MVVSNHIDHAETAAWYGVEYEHLPVVDGDKAVQESKLDAVLRTHDVDVVVLARYMQILSPEFCAAWSGRRTACRPCRPDRARTRWARTSTP